VNSSGRNITGRRQRSQVDLAQIFELLEQVLKAGDYAEPGVYQFVDFGIVPGVAPQLVTNPQQCLSVEFLNGEQVS
jgi:hypothetical protein